VKLICTNNLQLDKVYCTWYKYIRHIGSFCSHIYLDSFNIAKFNFLCHLHKSVTFHVM